MSQPLADRMRPQSFSDFRGQSQIEPDALAGQSGSMLFFGPPGCGKSTLALLLAQASGRSFIRLSAPEAGINQLRQAIAGKEILILDELHRFSKAQQDFFLPLLESGQLTLFATTTENPAFSVTRQLLSRMHVLRLLPLGKQDLIALGKAGADRLGIELCEESLALLAVASRGDARALLNLVEYTASLPEQKRLPENLAQALPETLSRHDRDGDSHYELASALIKSIRGSDPDAALYYLACLLEGGEDPRFICRRLILSASEDVGLADPGALQMAVACQQAVELIGMPEGFIPLAETTVYLSLARKSNSAYAAYIAASREVKQNGCQPVPFHLRNAATSLQKTWGFGKDYKYPHNYPESWVQQAYLPEKLASAKFYKPRANGQEAALSAWWRKKTAFRNP